MGLDGPALEVSGDGEAISDVAENGGLEDTGRARPLREHFCQYER